MTDHFAASVEIKDAVIGGDRSGVQSPAGELARSAQPFPEAWAPFMAANQRFAAQALAAKDLPAAAQAAAGLANTCGECHVAVGRGPHFILSRAPRRSRAHDAQGHMVRHQWAADRMWEALVAHDDAAWNAGAAAMATDSPLRRKERAVHTDRVAGSVEFDGGIVELGRRARTLAAWPERARLYGDVLASCAGCHAQWL